MTPNILEVALNNPKGNNRWDDVLFNEMVECFRIIPSHNDINCVLITAVGKHFTVGLDLKWAMKGSQLINSSQKKKKQPDAARQALHIQRHIAFLQKTTDLIQSCPVPVISAVHGACIGMGIDLISACDIRYASKDAQFSIKEVDVAIIADLGTFARLPKIIGNTSLLRELAYTGRTFTSEEALQLGLINRIFEDSTALRDGALALCKQIASKSPVAVRGIKCMLNYEMSGKSPADLQLMAQIYNGSALQTDDITKAGMAFFTKQKAKFSKL
eukprot:256627_1